MPLIDNELADELCVVRSYRTRVSMAQHRNFDSTFRFDSLRRVFVYTWYHSSFPSRLGTARIPLTKMLRTYLLPLRVHIATPSFIYWDYILASPIFWFAHSLIYFVLDVRHNYLHSLHSFARSHVYHATYTRPTMLKISSVIRRKQKQ